MRNRSANKKIQAWIKSGANTAASQKVLRDAILNKPEMQMALARYVNSLNLQGQVNKGIITEHQALELFAKGVQDFKRQLNTAINDCFTKNQLDQTNLANPLNMQLALANSNTLASQQMADSGPDANIEMDREMERMSAEMVLSIEMETQFMQQAQQQRQEEQMQEEQTQEEQQDQSMQQQSMQQQSMEDGKSSSHDPEDVVKGASISEAIKASNDKPESKEADKLMENAFHDNTGMEGSFEKAAEASKSKEDSFSSLPVPRPPTRDEDD